MPAQIFWHAPHLLPLVVALAVAVAAAVLWLYPAQVRRVRRPWRWVLPALRIAGLLVLAVSLLQPAARRLRRAEERAALVVVVDRSRSMSVTDLGRTPAQLVALADGLGRLPPGMRGRGLAGLPAELERLRERVGDVVSAGQDVETAEAFGRGVEAARARLGAARAAFTGAADALADRASTLPPAGGLSARLAALKGIPDAATRQAWAADARARIDAALAAVTAHQVDADAKLYETNPQVKAACDELAQRSRWSLVEDALLRNETGLAARVSADMPLVAYAVGDTVIRLTLPDVGDAAPRLPSVPDAPASDVAGAVAAALADIGSRPVRAVVLFSDGRQVGGDAAIVSGLAPAGVPVFAVGIASPGRPRDVAFARDVSVPASAFVGETLTVRASVTAAGLPPGGADVQLRAGDGDAEPQTQRIELRPDGAPSRAEFAVRFGRGGAQRVTISVAPTPGEITAENNVVERWVKVLPERMRVAAFAGTPGWDFQFLRNALSRTPWVGLESGVLDAAKPALPLTPDQILRQDVLVLSDVPAGALDDVQWDAVNRLVRERGGSLFLLAGPDHLPSSYTPSTIVPSALLPFDVRSFSPSWRTWPGEQAAFRFVPVPQLAADQSDALRIGPGPGSLQHWQGIGGAFRFMPVPELNARLNTRALLIEADSRLPVLTESRPGNGRVFFVGTNETWRWRQKVGGRDFDRFWLQLLRYAAGEPYAVQRDALALDADKVAPAPGEAVNVRARILRDDADRFLIRVLRGAEVVQEQRLAPGGDGGGRYTATVSGLGPGEYALRLVNPSDDQPDAPVLEVPLHVAGSTEAEMTDVSGDDDLLRRLADASGGEFLSPERLAELPGLLAATGETRSRYSEISLWDSPLLFLFVVACFGGEWALRKRVGLA